MGLESAPVRHMYMYMCLSKHLIFMYLCIFPCKSDTYIYIIYLQMYVMYKIHIYMYKGLGLSTRPP
jgi:hypothetical protein